MVVDNVAMIEDPRRRLPNMDVLLGQTNNFKLGTTSDTAATGYNTYGATVPTGNV